MSKGMGQVQRQILNAIADGEWHDLVEITHPDAIALPGHYHHSGGSRPLVMPGEFISVRKSGTYRSAVRAVKRLEESGHVQTRRRGDDTGRPYMVKKKMTYKERVQENKRLYGDSHDMAARADVFMYCSKLREAVLILPETPPADGWTEEEKTELLRLVRRIRKRLSPFEPAEVEPIMTKLEGMI